MSKMAASCLTISTLLLLSFLALTAANEMVISLDGDNWQLSDSFGKVKGLQATVPGQVHTDL